MSNQDYDQNQNMTQTTSKSPSLDERLGDLITLPDTEASFETQLAALERIVQLLEAGDTPLETSLALYEAGVQVQSRCQSQLGDAEQRVAVLTKQHEQIQQSWLEEDKD